MWRLYILRILYYSFFALIFIVAIILFLKLVNFSFFSPGIREFLNNFINSINL